jgi:5-amino-6-(5-phosphoribosylamino)uracil reductase
VDLAVVVARLAAEHGVRRLYVIGGPTLNAGLLEAGLVDELFLTVAPQLHGGTRLPSIVEGTGAEPHPHLRLRAAYAAGDELLLRYALGDPPPG